MLFKAGKFSLIRQQHGLAENAICSVLEDDFGWFWLLGDKELQTFSRQGAQAVAEGKSNRVHCIRYGRQQGLTHVGRHSVVAIEGGKSRDGRLWFPTPKGVLVADPAELRRADMAPQVFIENVVLDHETIAGEDLGRSNETPLNGEPQMKLLRRGPGRGRSLLIRYAAANFVDSEPIRFQYKLEGHDADWLDETDKTRIAVYTDLHPGPYKFLIRAFNSYGVPSESATQLALSLAPHFYQTWPFYALCTFAVLATGGTLHLFRVRGLSRIKQLEQVHALELERARIARDMHDSLAADLTKIAVMADMAQRQSVNGRSDAARWSKVGGLARGLVDDVGELIWATNPRNNSVNVLAAFLRSYAAELLESANLRARLEFPDEIPSQPISGEARRHLFLAAKEALNNVVRHAQATEVRVRFELLDGEVRIAIRDNGRGFVETTVRETSGQVRCGGNGLRNLHERVAALRGHCRIQTKPGEGTCITITAPLSRADERGQEN
jgi:signal transduction histidine kinase